MISDNRSPQPPASRLRSVDGRGGWLVAAGAAASWGLSLSRALAEGPSAIERWVAAPMGTILLTGLVVALALVLWHAIDRVRGHRSPAIVLASLLLSLGYLLSDGTDARRAAVWLTGSLLLTAVSIAIDLVSSKPRQRDYWPAAWSPVALLVVVTMGVYLTTMGRTVGQADTFEFQVVAYRLGIAHPTGYPLYVLLGKLFTLLPIESVAWRVNLLSAVCASGATVLVYAILRRWSSGRVGGLAIVGALAFAFSPTLWSQAVEAEVYALNSLFVALAVGLMLSIVHEGEASERVPALFLVLGLSLSNHVTTLILLPAAVLALGLSRPRLPRRRWLLSVALFVLGLAVYLYLPARWPTLHNGARMSLRQFVGWVTGSQFAGALQLGAWHADPTRYAIVGRLVLSQWGWFGIVLGVGGLFWLVRKHWRSALITLVVWLGYAFYGLSYYVPDISVFLIPAHLVQVVWMSLGAMALTRFLSRPVERSLDRAAEYIRPVAVALFGLVPLFLLTHHWSLVDRSGSNPLEAWGRRVLALDLERGAAILADSEKIAPLYYLQQTEQLRPDLEIMVLPDEATYRAELDARVAAGQEVYLARFLPQLQGVYHLRSVGPLIEVSPAPLSAPPFMDGRLDRQLGEGVTLLGYTLDTAAPAYPDAVHVTLFWRADARPARAYDVRLRLVDDGAKVVWESDGAHPVDNSYPTSAWRPGEVVPDAHDIPWQLSLEPADYVLQVAMLLPYSDDGLTPDSQTEPWIPIAALEGQPPCEFPAPRLARSIRVGEGVISGLNVDDRVRPGAVVPAVLFFRDASGGRVALEVGWAGESMTPVALASPITTLLLTAPDVRGEHELVMTAEEPLRCGWLARPSRNCQLAEVTVVGAALPPGAVNFQNVVALLSSEVADYELQPGGTLEVMLTWQVLAPMVDDYTVFMHVLDAADQIVGQVDAWPVQGTYPTSQMPVGEVIEDPYRIVIDPDASPGTYRLEIGWYLLGSMRRLNVVAAGGEPVDDRVLIEGFVVR